LLAAIAAPPRLLAAAVTTWLPRRLPVRATAPRGGEPPQLPATLRHYKKSFDL
jgi:hypothetical protein